MRVIGLLGSPWVERWTGGRRGSRRPARAGTAPTRVRLGAVLPRAASRRVHQPRPPRPARRTARQSPQREISASQAGYDLRRLRAHGLNTRIPGTQSGTDSPTPAATTPRCSPTSTRLLQPGLAQLTDPTHQHPADCAPSPRTISTPSKTSLSRPEPPHEKSCGPSRTSTDRYAQMAADQRRCRKLG
jgi:hypothetical protein